MVYCIHLRIVKIQMSAVLVLVQCYHREILVQLQYLTLDRTQLFHESDILWSCRTLSQLNQAF